MKITILITLISSLCFSFISNNQNTKIDISKSNQHLKEYSKFAVSHHDNIDTESKNHVHKHKHSEDGKEHDHDHDHSNIINIEIVKISKTSISTLLNIPDTESTDRFFVRAFLSTAFPNDLFKPPIV